MVYFFCLFVPGLLVGAVSLYLSIITGYWPLVLLGWALVSGLGIATGFHRIYSHKTHDLKPWMDNLILFLGTLGGQGSSISWVAVHRGYHHRHSDTEKDLHSPVHGYLSAFGGWYMRITKTTINHAFAGELLRRKNHVFVHKHYFMILITFMLMLLAISPMALMVYGSVLFLSLLQDNMVNVVCHTPWMGYKNWDTKDRSVNNFILGFLGWGQGWHENHHKHPASYDFGHKWWEIDPARIFLPILKLGATARDRKTL